VDVPGVTVDGDRVVHGRLDAGRRVIGSRGGRPLATVVDEGGLTKRVALVDGTGLAGAEGVARL
jgi:hypothetical protein